MGCEVIEGLDGLSAGAVGGVLTMGNFDGVHLGHQRLLSRASELARRAGVNLCAMTFDPPPAVLLDETAVPERIMPPEVKHRCLAECGADVVIVVETTGELLSTPPRDFVRDVVAARLAPLQVVEGHNFFFGRGRAGDVELLGRMAGELGFGVEVVEPVMVELPGRGSVRVSSSLIRELIRGGEVASAARCLGRPFTLHGRVVAGQQRGRLLEFPTANLAAAGQITPADGVYAARAEIAGASFPAAVSVGVKPTFAPSPRAVEAFLIGTEGDFYDRQMALAFCRRLRDQQEFPDAESLKRQIAKDIERVREIVK